RGSCILSWKQIMPRRLRVYLMDRGHHMAGAVGAEPYPMSNGWAETGIMEDVGARTPQRDGSPEALRGHGRQHCLHLHRVLLAEAPADKRRYDLHAFRRQAQGGGQAMANTLCVLSGFVQGELAVLPLCKRRQQLDRVVVLGGGDEARVDFYRGLFERLVAVARHDLRTKLLRRRTTLIG